MRVALAQRLTQDSGSRSLSLACGAWQNSGPWQSVQAENQAFLARETPVSPMGCRLVGTCNVNLVDVAGYAITGECCCILSAFIIDTRWFPRIEKALDGS